MVKRKTIQKPAPESTPGEYNADQDDYYPPSELRFSSEELSEDIWDQ